MNIFKIMASCQAKSRNKKTNRISNFLVADKDSYKEM